MELKLANKLKDIVKRHQVSVAQHSCTQGCSALREAPGGVRGHRAAAAAHLWSGFYPPMEDKSWLCPKSKPEPAATWLWVSWGQAWLIYCSVQVCPDLRLRQGVRQLFQTCGTAEGSFTLEMVLGFCFISLFHCWC